MGEPRHVWGLISDVHGNYPALVEALAVLDATGVEKYAFLGDYLGRGDSDGCIALIRERADVALLGNRDLDWQDRVSADSRAWVSTLPRLACVDGLLLTHGDARLTPVLSTAQINRHFALTWPALERANARIGAFGHSHFARTWRKASAPAPAVAVTAAETAIEPGMKYFVNVGTTGLPFGGKGGPSVAVIDFSRGLIRHLPLAKRRPE